MADNEDKDIPMEEGAEVDEDELLGTEGKNGDDEQDETMKEDATDADGDKEKPEEEKKEEKEEEEDLDDGGAASDVEFTTEDDRVPQEETVWKWHIELYPLAPEDVSLDNFVKMVSTAASSHVVYRDNERGEKRGEAHFYTQDTEAAQSMMRTICCRKFTFFRPFIYLYHLKEGTEDEYETAYLRLDLIESAKMRWDKQKKNKGEATLRVAKVSDVPLDTSKEFLKVLFARAFLVKQESDQSEEEAKKAQEAAEKDEAKAESSTADKTEENDEEEDKKEEEEEELVGEFNGNLTVDCCSRTSLRGFLLGYRKIIIGSSLLVIKPLDEALDIDALRKEVRKRRCYEAIHGKEWKPVTAADRVSRREEDFEDRAGGRGDRGGRGRGGFRGGRGGRGGGGGGGGGSGVMTGRQKMNEKSMRRGGGGGGGGRDDRRRGGSGGGSYAEDMRYLQSQLAMNTFELQRQIASLRGRDRGYGGGFRDFEGPMGGFGGGYGRDDWGYGGGGRGGSRYGGGGGGGGGGGRKQQRGGWR